MSVFALRKSAGVMGGRGGKSPGQDVHTPGLTSPGSRGPFVSHLPEVKSAAALGARVRQARGEKQLLYPEHPAFHPILSYPTMVQRHICMDTTVCPSLSPPSKGDLLFTSIQYRRQLGRLIYPRPPSQLDINFFFQDINPVHMSPVFFCLTCRNDCPNTRSLVGIPGLISFVFRTHRK